MNKHNKNRIGPFTLSQVARKKNVSRQAVWQAVKDGRLDAEKIGSYYLVSKMAMENWHPRGEHV